MSGAKEATQLHYDRATRQATTMSRMRSTIPPAGPMTRGSPVSFHHSEMMFLIQSTPCPMPGSGAFCMALTPLLLRRGRVCLHVTNTQCVYNVIYCSRNQLKYQLKMKEEQPLSSTASLQDESGCPGCTTS